MANFKNFKKEKEEEAKAKEEIIMPVIVTRCKKCGHDEFEETEKMHTPMLKCDKCGYEMVDDFLVYGRI